MRGMQIIFSLLEHWNTPAVRAKHAKHATTIVETDDMAAIMKELAKYDKNLPLMVMISTHPDTHSDERMREVAAIEEPLAKFGEHKDVLLSLLQEAYERGPKAEPFDKDASWSRIEAVAWMQYWQQGRFMCAADRKKLLRELEGAVAAARMWIGKAMQSPGLGNDLMNEWLRAEHAEGRPHLLGQFRSPPEFEKLVNELRSIETAAARAASRTPGRGRPKGSSVLSPFFVSCLADAYQASTGTKPDAGQGPFARFVRAYVAAIGLGGIEDASLVDSIKDTLRPREKFRETV